MKKLTVIPILLLAIITAHAQEDVVIDFKNKKISSKPTKQKLREKGEEGVRVKITDLPAGAYKVSINKTDSTINVGTPPALFGALSFGDGFTSVISGLTGFSVHTAGVVVAKQAAGGGAGGGAGLAAAPRFNLYSSEGVEAGTLEKIDISASFVSQQSCANAIANNIKAMRKVAFEHYFDFRDKVIIEADNLMYDVNLPNTTLTDATFKSRAEAIITARLKSEKDLETAYLAYYDAALPEYEDVKRCIALATGDSMLAAYKKNFSQFLNKFDTTFNKTLITKIYKQLKAPPTADFVSFPYPLTKDVTTLAIEVTGVDASKTPQSFSTSIQLDKYPNRLWAFTSGIYASCLGPQQYSLIANLQKNAANPTKYDTLNYNIKKEGGTNRLEAGISAMMHLGGYFHKSDIGYFGCFGPGLSIEKTPRFRLLLGGGLMFGRSNKISISGGIIAGSVRTLSSLYNPDSTYELLPTDMIRDKFQCKGFISLGYALFGK